MQTITISEGQTLVDIAARYCGDASLAVDIAILNGVDIDDIVMATTLKVPDCDISKRQIVATLNKRNVAPASALTTPLVDDSWAIYWGEYE